MNSFLKDNSIEQFNQQKKTKAIVHYRVLILILSVINITIIIFFVSLKSQIKTVEKSNSTLSIQINRKETTNTEFNHVVNHQLLNLLTLRNVFQKEEISLIYSIEEFDTILSWIHSKCSRVFLCFTSNTHPTLPSYDIFEYCNKNNYLIFIIKTKKGHRFGGAVKIYEYSTEEIQSHTFLFNLDTKKKFDRRKGKEDQFYFGNQASKVSFGEDLVIHQDYLYSNSSYSKFPQDYGESNATLFDLTGDEEYFVIEQLEILDSL